MSCDLVPWLDPGVKGEDELSEELEFEFPEQSWDVQLSVTETRQELSLAAQFAFDWLFPAPAFSMQRSFHRRRRRAATRHFLLIFAARYMFCAESGHLWPR